MLPFRRRLRLPRLLRFSQRLLLPLLQIPMLLLLIHRSLLLPVLSRLLLVRSARRGKYKYLAGDWFYRVNGKKLIGALESRDFKRVVEILSQEFRHSQPNTTMPGNATTTQDQHNRIENTNYTAYRI
jgi:hypothetical protein